MWGLDITIQVFKDLVRERGERENGGGVGLISEVFRCILVDSFLAGFLAGHGVGVDLEC